MSRFAKLVPVVILAAVIACIGGYSAYKLLTYESVRARNEGSALIGGPFQLVSDTGQTVTEADLRTRPSVLYFGYTYCPEVCPTTLLAMSQWIKALGPDADRLNYVFVTIDPRRDTPKVMHAYVASFDHRIRGYTGTQQQIAQIAKEYRVYYRRIPTGPGTYLMDHSTLIYLMSREGRLFGLIQYQEDSKSAVEKLRNLIKNGG